MKIFEDPPLPGNARGSSSNHSPFRKPRKTVSFVAGNSKTSSEHHGSIKTPLRNKGNTYQSPGRTPKIVKSSSMTVAAFRQNLRTPPAISPGGSKFDRWDDKENAYYNNQWGIEEQSSKTSTLKKSFTEKTATNTTMETTSPRTPISASLFRRTLRATIEKGNGLHQLASTQVLPVSESSDNPTTFFQKSHRVSSRIGASRMTELGPPQRIAPKTPNSLLRTEMEELDSSSNAFATDANESLLLSPPPGAVWNAMNLSYTNVATSTGVVVVSPHAAAKLQSWSLEQKLLSNKNTVASPRVRNAEDSFFDNTSPAKPRTVLYQTPEFQTVDHTDNDNIAEGPLNEATIQNVEKKSKGGVAMDLTRIFSLERNRMISTDCPNQNVRQSSVPLSASLPPALLARLNANHQGLTTETIFQDDLLRRSSSRMVSSNHYEMRMRMDSGFEKGFKNSKPRRQKNDEMETMGETGDRVSKLNSNLKKYESGPSLEASLTKRLVTTPKVPQTLRKANVGYGKPFVQQTSEISRKDGMAFESIFPEEKKYSASDQNSSSMTATETAKPTSTSNDWADKQSASFVGWLNYTFNPEEDGHSDETVPPTGLRGLLIHRRLAGVRSKAKDLFQSESMRNSRMILLREISSGRLAIRKDRDVTADVQLRNQIVALLLSYTTPWLRIGLEVMFDETIEPLPIMQNGPRTYLGRMKVALESFIKLRFLSDGSTLEKFTKGRCNVPSGIFETRYKAQMRCLVLSRVMILVLFLDFAKSQNLLDKVPRLFTVSSEVKSSRDVLVAICRACLFAEGDIVKHLSRIGLNVLYHQDPIDEVHFKVFNLATDLRDGVLLTRLSEIVTESSFKSIMKSLRLPVISRLQKKHNVNVALDTLRIFGIFVPDVIGAHHIMDGHREMVLALMWCIISHCCMTRLLQKNMVEQEIQDVVRSSQARSKVTRLLIDLSSNKEPAFHRPPNVFGERKTMTEEVLKGLLLRWSQAVCASFGLRIDDCIYSFADGTALCLLINYYHPALMPVEEIYFPPGIDDTNHCINCDKRREKERSNWTKAIKAIKELGGIPALLPISDSESPPDEQSMLLCLSYLCSRLMESSKEIFATILIQAHYRKYQRLVLLERKIAAAKFITSFWFANRQNYYRAQRSRYAGAVALLEEFVLSHKEALQRIRDSRMEKKRRIEAATQIQRLFRGLQGRELCYLIWEQRQGALLIQKHWRRMFASQRVRYLLVRQKGAVVLQSFARRCFAVCYFLCVRQLVTSVQRLVRGFLWRRRLGQLDVAAFTIQQAWWSYVSRQYQKYASLLIQKTWRGVKDRQKFRERRKEFRAVSCIQKVWRAYFQWISYMILAESTVLLQRVFRGFLSRKTTSFRRSQLAATTIQKIWRGFSEQVRFQIDFMDIICVQGVVRRYLALNIRNEKIRATAVLQGAIRCTIARRNSLAARSARMIQAYWRAHRNRERFLNCRFAVIHVQRLWREHSIRQTVKREAFAATIIQKSWRRYWVYTDYKMFLKENEAAVVIQAGFRSILARHFFETLRFSVRTVQRWWRVHMESRRQREAAIFLQKTWRSCSQRKHFKSLQATAVKIQSITRNLLAKKDLENRRREKAATSLQRIWRGFSQQVLFQLEVLDIIFAQSTVRRYLAEKDYGAKYQAILVLQRSYRCSESRKQLVLRKLARMARVSFSVVTLQALFRSKSKREEYIAAREASIAVQRFWRGFVVRCAMWNLSFAASEIQRIWRRYSSRCSYLLLLFKVRSAVMIQSGFRMHHARISLRRRQHAAVAIQCAFRCYQSRKHLSALLESQRIHEQLLQATLVVQSRIRGAGARRKLATVQASVAILQKCFRRQGRKRQLLDAVVTIQSVLRCYVQRKRCIFTRLLAMNMQRLIRGYSSRKIFARKRDAATCIQSQWRCYVAQTKYLLDLLEEKCAVAIQATFRMFQQRVDYMVIKFAAHTIQRYTRGLLTRVDVAVKHFAATEIQRIWKGYATYSFDAILLAVVKIQSVLRMARAKQHVKELSILYWADLCFHHRNSILIQCAFKKYQLRKRMHTSAQAIQKMYRFFSQQKRIQRFSKGMMLFQSFFRGWRARKMRNKKMIRAAQRIQRERIRALNNPELRLGNRTNRALYILQTSQSLTRIMDAVKELEASTRLSVVCCQVFTKANAANILLHLIQSCNRSVPHMELKEHILLTLENVSRYSSLVHSFAHPKYAEVFLDNVQVFRDKDGIFCLAVSLLNRISLANPNVGVYCSSHEHLKRLKEVYRVVSRRLNPRESHSFIDNTPRKNTLKKRVDFNRDYSIKVLGQMIESFSLVDTLPTTEQNQKFRFDW